MKKVNFPLVIGSILLLILSIISFFPDKVATKDPNFEYVFRAYTIMEDGEEVSKVDLAPWGPNKENIMGVDELGRDMYTRIIYGARVTLKTALLIVALRFLLAIPIGIIAGVGSKIAATLINFFNTVFTAIPILFVSFFILNIEFINEMQVDQSIIAFALVLSILGWGKLGKQVEERARQIMKEEFIEGEIAVGKSKMQIAIQNMLPHLVPSLISIVFIEVGLVIFLLAQLSIFQVFIGPRIHFVRFGGDPGYFISENPEWGAMLSRIVINNKIGKYWMGFYPALAFTLGILAFNLTGEGLRIEFEKRTSKVASNIRKLGFIFSPKVYYQQILRFKEYSKPVILKSMSLIVLMVYIFMPPMKSLYPFEIDQAMSHLEELIKPEYGGRYTGFEGNQKAGDYIIERLKEYGLAPYDGESFVQELPNDESYNFETVVVEEAYIDIKSEEGDISSYEFRKDFIFTSFRKDDIDNTGILDENGYIVVSGLASPKHKEFGMGMIREDDDRIVVDHRYTYDFVLLKGKHDSPIHNTKISFLTIDGEAPLKSSCSSGRVYNIIPKGELAEKLNSQDYQVELKIKPPQLSSYNSRNIFAVLPGKDWSKPESSQDKKEIIIIGSSYDGFHNEKGTTSPMVTAKSAINLEIARVLSEIEEPLDKTIVFAFWDSTEYTQSGPDYYDKKDRVFTQQYHKISYFDIATVNDKNNINIQIYSPNSFQVETYNLKGDMVKHLKKKQYKHAFTSSRSDTFDKIGLNMSLKIGLDSGNYMYLGTERDTIENINQVQMTNMGQFFIDLITMNEYFK